MERAGLNRSFLDALASPTAGFHLRTSPSRGHGGWWREGSLNFPVQWGKTDDFARQDRIGANNKVMSRMRREPYARGRSSGGRRRTKHAVKKHGLHSYIPQYTCWLDLAHRGAPILRRVTNNPCLWGKSELSNRFRFTRCFLL